MSDMHPIFLIPIVLVGGGLILFNEAANKKVDTRRSNLYEDVRVAADRNRDGATSPDEWRAAYKEMGVTWNSGTSPSKRDLSLDTMQRYNSRNQHSISAPRDNSG
jgi:hypothetical protein